MLAVLMTDFYKQCHAVQYPAGTTMVYSNLTPRSSRVPGIDKVVVFGIQYFLKEYLVNRFTHDFFSRPRETVLWEFSRRMDTSLGKGAVSTDNIRDLHQLGYLPLRVKALPEGSLCPLRVPILTIQNTVPEFFWLTNFVETILSTAVWHGITCATIARQYRLITERYARETSDNVDMVKFQCHDFSMRGQTSLESARMSGAAHLTSFVGTDTIPAIDFLEEYYYANADEEFIAGSVPASEHATTCVTGPDGELSMYKRMITEVFPTGIVSLVADSYDYWESINVRIRSLKDVIMGRLGKVVCRPDSGLPEDILCGDVNSPNELARKGTVQLLWEIFGGTINTKGYKELDPHIGVIYGDSITLERAETILRRLKGMGFASTNVILGVGSYSYQYVTRDTFGLAVKATAAEVDGQLIEIYKDPKTDDGIKKSARGLLMVYPEMVDGRAGDFKLFERVTAEQERTGCLQTVFLNGKITKEYSLEQIRHNLERELQGEYPSV